ncbi:hypothetical protein SLS58_003708 [Diplodia intermedia]|uniref:Uncharacterized protein n=1 Tax=Diplodia intermedia TaxID=856260 RepID=A0ABR3TWK9_9PEZI
MPAGNMLFQERILTSGLFEQADYELKKSPLAKLDHYHHHFNLEFDTSHASRRDIQVDINMESTVVFLNPACHHDSHNLHEQYLFSTINFKADFFFDNSQNHNSDFFNVDNYCLHTTYIHNVYCIKPDFITPRLIQVYFANVHINLYFCFDDIFFDINYIESATTDIFSELSFIFDKILYNLALDILILDKHNLHTSYTYKCHSPSLEYFGPALVQKHSISYFDLIIYRTSSYDFEHIAYPSSNHSPGHSLYLRSYDSFYHNTYYRSCRTLYRRPYHESNNTSNNNTFYNIHSLYESFHVRSLNKHTIYDGPFNESAFNAPSDAPTTSNNFDAAYRFDFTAITNSAFSYIVSKQPFSK